MFILPSRDFMFQTRPLVTTSCLTQSHSVLHSRKEALFHSCFAGGLHRRHDGQLSVKNFGYKLNISESYGKILSMSVPATTLRQSQNRHFSPTYWPSRTTTFTTWLTESFDFQTASGFISPNSANFRLQFSRNTRLG